MQFYRSFCLAVFCPVKHTRTKFDNCCVKTDKFIFETKFLLKFHTRLTYFQYHTCPKTTRDGSFFTCLATTLLASLWRMHTQTGGGRAKMRSGADSKGQAPQPNLRQTGANPVGAQFKFRFDFYWSPLIFLIFFYG